MGAGNLSLWKTAMLRQVTLNFKFKTELRNTATPSSQSLAAEQTPGLEWPDVVFEDPGPGQTTRLVG